MDFACKSIEMPMLPLDTLSVICSFLDTTSLAICRFVSRDFKYAVDTTTHSFGHKCIVDENIPQEVCEHLNCKTKIAKYFAPKMYGTDILCSSVLVDWMKSTIIRPDLFTAHTILSICKSGNFEKLELLAQINRNYIRDNVYILKRILKKTGNIALFDTLDALNTKYGLQLCCVDKDDVKAATLSANLELLQRMDLHKQFAKKSKIFYKMILYLTLNYSHTALNSYHYKNIVIWLRTKLGDVVINSYISVDISVILV